MSFPRLPASVLFVSINLSLRSWTEEVASTPVRLSMSSAPALCLSNSYGNLVIDHFSSHLLCPTRYFSGVSETEKMIRSQPSPSGYLMFPNTAEALQERACTDAIILTEVPSSLLNL